jgi:hypothetical protein
MLQQKPTVFIGSSSKESAVLNTVARLLKPYAKVTPWTQGDDFKRIGEYLLDSLSGAPENFDFAVIIFGPDDRVESGGKFYHAPRANVVFELGLFLSKLGRARTFVIAPRPGESGLNILSDIQGLNLAEYDPPESGEGLEQSLKRVCKEIGEKMLQRGPAQALKGPKGVTDMPMHIENLLTAARSRKASSRVRNIALDMEVTWPIVRDKILGPLPPQQFRDITWQSLIIDSLDEKIQRHSSETVSVIRAQAVEDSIRDFCKRHESEWEERNVKFECRTYSVLPTIHGFLFNNEVLFFSVCGMKGGKLVGSPNPYIEMTVSGKRQSDKAPHFIQAFDGWFEHFWKHGRHVWPG